MINISKNNIPLICNMPKDKIDKLFHKYVNPTFYGTIKTFTNNDR